ncbi:ABC transporter permease [Pseudorhizobium sp. NPDC055634]
MRTLLSRRPLLLAGIVLTAALSMVALLSLFWTPLPPAKMQIAARLKAPMEHGLLGTDQFGRDMVSMLMGGAWNSLSTAVAAVAIGASLGTLIGLAVATRSGWVSSAVMRGCDIIFAIPPILSAMMLAAFIGAGRFTAIIAIAVFMIPVFARLALAAAMQIWTLPYVRAAIGMGRANWKITLVHVLPNIAGLIIVQVTIQLGLAILTEAGLGFLGLGMAPPAPSWGRMLADAQTYLGQAPWLALLPGLAIFLSVLGFSLLGDGLRDHLDRRSR